MEPKDIRSALLSMQDAEYLEFIGKNPELASIFAECSAFKFRVEDFESAFAAVKAGECIKAVFVS